MDSAKITLIVLVLVLILVMIVLSVVGNNYKLDSIKRRTVGDGQHGTARWATNQEISNDFKRVSFTPELWRKGLDLPTAQGIIVGSIAKGKKTFATVDSSDVHTLMIGAAGVGKTAYWLYPNLEYACATGMSFITTDTKGDLMRNYGAVAKNHYGYNVSVIDLRNPTRSNENNILHLVNKYMDVYKSNPDDLSAKAKAEKYAKIIAKTVININGGSADKGQNAFFYDAAEGLLASLILLIAELGQPGERHIISGFRMIQDLLKTDEAGSSAKDKKEKKTGFSKLMDMLPDEHKAKWLAGAALHTATQSMMSVMSTALATLNSFIDSEMEQILCFDNELDTEKFCKEKSAIFIILPEEDKSKYFLVSLLIQQIYRELLQIADENGGRLPNRVMFFLDEFGTLPKIEGAELMFSASRSRAISIAAVIQSFAQLAQTYGKEGAEIIIDNTQLTVFGGFAPNSQTADQLSRALGNQTVLSGSISRGGGKGTKNDSQSLQMIQRQLMTSDELKALPKGQFVIMKTGCHPMITKLRLFTEWGIVFYGTYAIPDKGARRVRYLCKDALMRAVELAYPPKITAEKPTDFEVDIPTISFPLPARPKPEPQLQSKLRID